MESAFCAPPVKIFCRYPEKCVFLHLLSRAKVVSKKSIANILSLKIRQINEGGLSIICFRLVVCYLFQHTFRREIKCSIARSLKGVWRYLKDNDEHVTSCLFLLL